MQAVSLNKTNVLKPETDKLLQAQRDARGLYYRIPDKASISLKVGGQVKIETQFVVNQFGVITLLPASSIRNLSIDNNTGSLRHVVLE